MDEKGDILNCKIAEYAKAVIDGKPKDALIKQVGILWVTVTDKFRKKADETEG